MNKRGITEAPSAFGGVVFEVLILILILYVAFAFLRAGLFPDNKDTSLENFNSFVTKVDALLSDPAQFAASELSLELDDQYTIVGFSKEKDTFETCGDAEGDLTGGLVDDAEPIEKINKPLSCGDKACICLYKDDTKLGNADNLDFNAAIAEGYQKVISCHPLEADYLFSHPYSIFGGGASSYRSLKREWAATSNTLFNEGGYPSAADADYYLLTHANNDLTRNFRGYLWEGPYAFNFREFGSKYTTLENGEAKDVSIPRTPNPDNVRVSLKEPALYLNYFEDRLNLYKWCESRGFMERSKCVQELKNFGMGNIDEASERILSKVYSSFVLYGECQSAHQKFDDGEFNIGAVYLEKFNDPDTGKTLMFFGLSSPYTAERATVMGFFRGEETTSSETPIIPKFEGLVFDMGKITDYQINEVKKNHDFIIKNFNGKSSDAKATILLVDKNAELDSDADPKLISREKMTIQFDFSSAPYHLRKYDLTRLSAADKNKFFTEFKSDASSVYNLNEAGAKFRLAFHIVNEDTVLLAIFNTASTKTGFVNIPELNKEKQQLFE